MSKRLAFKAVLDGFIGGSVLYLIGSLLVSSYAVDLNITHYLLLGLLPAILYALLFVILTHNISSIKTVLYYFLISVFSSVLWIFILINGTTVFGIDFFPVREANNADGLLILFISGCFAFASVVLRCCVLVVRIILKKTKQIGQIGQGTVRNH